MDEQAQEVAILQRWLEPCVGSNYTVVGRVTKLDGRMTMIKKALAIGAVVLAMALGTMGIQVGLTGETDGFKLPKVESLKKLELTDREIQLLILWMTAHPRETLKLEADRRVDRALVNADTEACQVLKKQCESTKIGYISDPVCKQWSYCVWGR